MEPFFFSIRSSSFMCFYHLGECCEVFETNLSFLSVVLAFSGIEPRFFKQQYVFISCLFIIQYNGTEAFQ